MSSATRKTTTSRNKPRQRRPRQPVFRLNAWSSLGLVLVLAALTLLLIYSRPYTQTIRLGEPADRAATLGFQAAERTTEGLPYRWTDDRSTLIFRGAGLAFPANRNQTLTLRVAASRPAGVAAPQFAVEIAGRQLGQQTVTGEITPRLNLGPRTTNTVDQQIALLSSTFTPPGDRRVLGVAVLGPVQLREAAGSGLAVPGIAAWLRWLVLLAGGWGLTWGLLRRQPLLATAVSFGALAALAVPLLLARSQFWELQHLLLLAVVVLLPLVWWREIATLSQQALHWAEHHHCPPAVVTLLGIALLTMAQALLSSNLWLPVALLIGAFGLLLVLATILGSVRTPAAQPEPDPPASIIATSPTTLSRRLELGSLVGILLLAALARLTNLGTIPFGMWRDEARHGLEALQILNDPTYRPVYIPNISLPGFYPALLARDFQFFGASLATLRGFTATAGVLAVGALWLVARQLWGSRVALVAALFGAVGSWRVSIDRLAFDTALTTLCTLLAFALFLVSVRQVRQGGRGLLAFAAAGLCGSLAIYNYYPGRFALPVLLGATLVLLWRERWAFARRAWPGLLLCLFIALVTLLPLVQYAREQPQNFFKRTEQVFVLSDQYIEGRTKLEAVEQNILRHVGMFNWRGEPNARHHAPNWPMLDGVTAACFAVGLALAVLLALRVSFSALFTLGWLLALLAPSIVSVDAPSAVRAQDAAPAAYLLAALGFVALWDRLRTSAAPRLLRQGAVVIGSAALIAAVAINLWLYFLRLPGDPKVLGKFQYVGETRAGIAIQAAHQQQPDLQVYVPPALLATEALQFTAYGTPLHELPTNAAALPAGPLLIVVARSEGRDFANDVAAARQLAAAAGLTEQEGARTPGTNEVTYITFRRDR